VNALQFSDRNLASSKVPAQEDRGASLWIRRGVGWLPCEFEVIDMTGTYGCIQGAGELSKHIETVYGRDGIAMIVDEGGKSMEVNAIVD